MLVPTRLKVSLIRDRALDEVRENRTLIVRSAPLGCGT